MGVPGYQSSSISTTIFPNKNHPAMRVPPGLWKPPRLRRSLREASLRPLANWCPESCSRSETSASIRVTSFGGKFFSPENPRNKWVIWCHWRLFGVHTTYETSLLSKSSKLKDPPNVVLAVLPSNTTRIDIATMDEPLERMFDHGYPWFMRFWCPNPSTKGPFWKWGSDQPGMFHSESRNDDILKSFGDMGWLFMWRPHQWLDKEKLDVHNWLVVLGHPSEKYESIGMMTFPILMGT